MFNEFVQMKGSIKIGRSYGRCVKVSQYLL